MSVKLFELTFVGVNLAVNNRDGGCLKVVSSTVLPQSKRKIITNGALSI